MYTLKNCVWEITLACCFSCKHCGSGGGKARSDELTREERSDGSLTIHVRCGSLNQKFMFTEI